MGIRGKQRPMSASASAQSDLGLCTLIESLDTIECTNGEQLSGSDFAHAQDESEYMCIWRMFEDAFLQM